MAPGEQALVIFDTEAPLACLLTDAYRAALPNAQFVDIKTVTPPDVMRLFEALNPKDLVVLIQSTNFRLNEFRIRIELFKRGLKTIEHTHLNRMPPEQYEAYVDAFAYDPHYYRPLGHALKAIMDVSKRTVVRCNGTTLTYDGPMEPSKLNVGDYTDMKNIGGTFPIGEVFTEPIDLATVNGEAMAFAFAGEDHLVQLYDPFKLIITNGVLTAPDAPADFQAILEKIRATEVAVVREFGLGLNRAMGKHRLVSDITAFERQQGLHFSIGAKHTVYAKTGLHRKHGRYHVDVFIDVETIEVDGKALYTNGMFHPNA
jgi:leucyl aminopeptidase (aminopeptidase T)